jgi:hypothetical protein
MPYRDARTRGETLADVSGDNGPRRYRQQIADAGEEGGGDQASVTGKAQEVTAVVDELVNIRT